MRSVLGNFFLVIYAILAITITILLLSYNEYMCSEIGGYTLYIVNDDTLEPDYKEGSLLLIKQRGDASVEVGDQILLYQNISKSQYLVKNSTLAEKVPYGRHVTYILDDGYQFDSSYLIGKTDETIAINGLGTILSILESKWGYLLCIVIVTLFLFLQELYELFMEVKYGNDSDEEEEKTKTTKKKTVSKSSTKGSK